MTTLPLVGVWKTTFQPKKGGDSQGQGVSWGICIDIHAYFVVYVDR